MKTYIEYGYKSPLVYKYNNNNRLKKLANFEPNNEIITIYENDLKYRKFNNIDLENIIVNKQKLDGKEIDYDTLEWRIEESKKKNESFLDISHMGFTIIPINLSKNIKELYLNNNNINYIDDLSFLGLERLQIVDLGSNKLKELPRFSDSIEEISCRGNLLTELNLKDYDYQGLKRLDCSENKIKKINTIDSLEILVCNQNELEEINEFKKLKKLDCRENKIKKISSLSCLEIIDCSKNQITQLNLSNIKEIYCNSNLIENFSNLENIKVIHCKDNNIKKLDYYPTLEELMCNYTGNVKISKSYNILEVIKKDDDKTILIYFKNLI